MVEFGLKLEDNTVEEWKSNYIDYEGLKKLIKNATKAHENRLELERRNPSVAADIKEMYQKRMNVSTLNQIVEDVDNVCDKESFVTQSGTATPDEVSQSENVSLLSGFDMSNIVSKYGSNDSNIHRSESSSSLGNFIKGVKKGLSFSYDSKMQSALEAETLAMEKFSIAIYKEVRLYSYSLFKHLVSLRSDLYVV
jgi:SPX domain-containing protein involved in vacuolar polyphosphate accumulation